MGEIVDRFPDNEFATQALCASCHVPIIAGIMPRRIGSRSYYDGLAWPSRLLVPWRGAEGDHVVRVSACGSPLADIRIPGVPSWWGGLPPKQEFLRGLFWQGYRDAAEWFAKEPQVSPDCCSSRRSSGHPGISASVVSEEISRWRRARALLQREPSAMLPEVDAATGIQVRALLEQVEALAGRDIKISHMMLTAMMVLFVSFLLAVQRVGPM